MNVFSFIDQFSPCQHDENGRRKWQREKVVDIPTNDPIMVLDEDQEFIELTGKHTVFQGIIEWPNGELALTAVMVKEEAVVIDV